MKKYIVAAIMVSALTLPGFAMAANGQEEPDTADAAAIAKVQVSLADAVRAAEQAQNGKALSAAFTAQGGYEVEVTDASGTVTNVTVDPSTAKVTVGGSHRDEGNEPDGEEGEDN